MDDLWNDESIKSLCNENCVCLRLEADSEPCNQFKQLCKNNFFLFSLKQNLILKKTKKIQLLNFQLLILLEIAAHQLNLFQVHMIKNCSKRESKMQLKFIKLQ